METGSPLLVTPGLTRGPAAFPAYDYAHKHKMLLLVDRNTGRARWIVVDRLKAADLTPILEANIAAEAHVMTDEAGQ